MNSKNYFEELDEKGIETVELTIEEVQDLFKQGRITQDQFNAILIRQVGIEKFIEYTMKGVEDMFKEENE